MTLRRQPASCNRLLADLPERSRRHFVASCDHVELHFADVLYRCGERIDHVYFPLGCFISSITELPGDVTLELGIIGNEGMLGIPVVLGVDIAEQSALVQGAGSALRMTTAALEHYCGQGSTLHRQLHRYAYVVMSQLAQFAACTHYHLIEARLARWLLMTRDRAHADEFRLTHEFLAAMLGVRRVAVSLAAGSLQRRGLIHYSRGVIAIIDAATLEKSACACYGRSKRLYDDVMHMPRGARSRPLS